jgi:hypothetical protein
MRKKSKGLGWLIDDALYENTYITSGDALIGASNKNRCRE